MQSMLDSLFDVALLPSSRNKILRHIRGSCLCPMCTRCTHQRGIHHFENCVHCYTLCTLPSRLGGIARTTRRHSFLDSSSNDSSNCGRAGSVWLLLNRRAQVRSSTESAGNQVSSTTAILHSAVRKRCLQLTTARGAAPRIRSSRCCCCVLKAIRIS